MTALSIDAISPAKGLQVPFQLKLAGALLLALLLSSFYPAAYMGGAGDDARYLEAIRCAVGNGYCVPANHWAARLPVVLPSALSLWLLGESRSTLVLAPLAYSAGAMTLLALLVRRFASESAAIIAACVLAATPVFINRAQRIGADMPELFFLLAGLWLLILGVDRNRRWLVVAAGAAFGLAVLSRTTAIATALIVAAGLVLFTRAPLPRIALLAIGGAAMLAAEAVLHWVGAGNPMLSWELAHAHTMIPSSALPAGLDLSRSPILNPDYIANWERGRGIELHWLLDGFLNFVADPIVSLTLAIAAVFGLSRSGASGSKQLDWSLRAKFLVGAVGAHFCLLTFVLAVHPTPRMFLPILCVAALTIGLWADRNRTAGGRLLIGATFASLIGSAVVQGLAAVDLAPYEREAERWARESKGGLAIEPIAASVFTLSPAVASLPSTKAAPGFPVLKIGAGCHPEGGHWPVLQREFVYVPSWGGLGGIGQRHGLGPRRLKMCIVEP